jgi:hypothetical protein
MGMSFKSIRLHLRCESAVSYDLQLGPSWVHSKSFRTHMRREGAVRDALLLCPNCVIDLYPITL